MTLDEAIDLFTKLQKDEYQSPIGFHLHRAIKHVIDNPWCFRTNQNYPETFAGFLKALKDHDPVK